jgi:hypothetical protein
MKNTFVLSVLCVAVLIGCTTVKTVQDETAPDGTKRHTEFLGRSFWDSQNELSKASATMTDKTQGVRISGLSQEASSTNVVSLAEKVVGAAVSAAVKSTVP